MPKKTKRKTRKSPKRRNPSKKKKNHIQSQWKKISAGAGVLSALSLITSHDMAASTGQPIGVRAKNFANSLTGRITGFSPFSSDSSAGGAIPQTVSIEGIFNKYTGIGLGLLGYAMIPAKILPHKAKARQLGKAVFGGGLLGGIFKPSTNPHTTNLLSPSNAITVSSSQVSYT